MLAFDFANHVPFFFMFVIAFAGTMSGGGNKVVKGRMGSSIVSDVSPDQLEAMERKLEKETKTAEVEYVPRWTD